VFQGFEPAALDEESFPECPLGPAVGAEVAVDAIGDGSFQGPHRFAPGAPSGELVAAIAVAFAVAVADLGHGDHVDGVVSGAVAASR
jgi:hypothetical protein